MGLQYAWLNSISNRFIMNHIPFVPPILKLTLFFWWSPTHVWCSTPPYVSWSLHYGQPWFDRTWTSNVRSWTAFTTSTRSRLERADGADWGERFPSSHWGYPFASPLDSPVIGLVGWENLQKHQETSGKHIVFPPHPIGVSGTLSVLVIWKTPPVTWRLFMMEISRYWRRPPYWRALLWHLCWTVGDSERFHDIFNSTHLA